MTETYATAHSTTVSNTRLRLLNKLKDGQYPLLTFMAIPSVRHAQIVALTGLDVSLSRQSLPPANTDMQAGNNH